MQSQDVAQNEGRGKVEEDLQPLNPTGQHGDEYLQEEFLFFFTILP